MEYDRIDDLSEEDVKRIYITPSLEKAGWTDIKMEKYIPFTEGKINVFDNGEMVRGKKKFADYFLKYNNTKLAIVEAKDANHTPGQGLLQSIEYARLLNIPFAYSSNGFGFVEHDLISGLERQLKMHEFPSPEVLRERYIKEKELTLEQLKLIEYPDYIDEKFKPRYYQKASVDKTLEHIAKGNKRALVVLATGTGKTYTAFQIVWKLKQMRKIKKVLYLADRNILITKPYNEEFAPFGDARSIIKHGEIKTSRDIFFGLYQNLENGKVESNLKSYKKLSPDFFDLIIVDECHRGSAKENSHWREILEYFNSAVQIGMTATPKVYVSKKIDGLDEESAEDEAKTWFGDPIYTYSLKQGIDDGYLAPYKVIVKHLDIDVDGYRPSSGERDINGNLLEDRIYTSNDFDRKIIVNSRIKEVANQITNYLKATDRFQKTIVFGCNIRHAENLRRELWNLNRDICNINPRYVTQITSDQPNAAKDLDDFTKVEFNKDLDPCIVTTSDLLSTGVDCKTAKLIVLDKVINSMTLFKQIIGRGTRLRIDDRKYEFYIMDFRNVTSLFADPSWDGPIEYIDSKKAIKKKKIIDLGNDKIPVYHIDGEKVSLVGEQVKILNQDGKLVTKSLINFVKEKINGEWATLNDFLKKWSESRRHQVIVDELKKHGVLLEDVRRELGISDEMDDFTLICHIGYGMRPMTISERVKRARKAIRFDFLSDVGKKVLNILLDKFNDQQIIDIDNIDNLNLVEFKQFGTPKVIINKGFGGIANYYQAIDSIKNNLFNIGG